MYGVLSRSKQIDNIYSELSAADRMVSKLLHSYRQKFPRTFVIIFFIPACSMVAWSGLP